MKLIKTGAALTSQLSRLIAQYSNISFGVAWASAETQPFSLLNTNKAKIKSGVIGIHFYQTDPDVLDAFIDSNSVKFVLQPQGVFHPKVFLFWDENNWEAIIGSANFTWGAMNSNTELCMLISQGDGAHLSELQDIIESYSGSAKSLSVEDTLHYRCMWEMKKAQRDRLLDNYGGRPANKMAVESSVMSMDWPTFLDKIKIDKTHGFTQRLALLEAVKHEFSIVAHFKDMALEVRKGIAGLPSNHFDNPQWFGSMVGAGVFRSRINSNDQALSAALDNIPLTGTVTKIHYDAFIDEYCKAFSGGRDGIGTATRLLCMKRPDQFLCVDSANRRQLAFDIGIPRADKLDYRRYWEEIVLRIMNTPWWNSRPPEGAEDISAWHARTAMLDAIFYNEDGKR